MLKRASIFWESIEFQFQFSEQARAIIELLYALCSIQHYNKFWVWNLVESWMSFHWTIALIMKWVVGKLWITWTKNCTYVMNWMKLVFVIFHFLVLNLELLLLTNLWKLIVEFFYDSQFPMKNFQVWIVNPKDQYFLEVLCFLACYCYCCYLFVLFLADDVVVVDLPESNSKIGKIYLINCIVLIYEV